MSEKRMSITVGLAVKLASIVVHADEYTDEAVNPASRGHAFDLIALRQLIADDEVLHWIGKMGPLAPLKRNARTADAEAK